MRTAGRGATAVRTARQPPMRFRHLAPGHGVLELPGPDRLELKLLVWWGGNRTHAAWLWAGTGKLAGWAEVGVA